MAKQRNYLLPCTHKQTMRRVTVVRLVLTKATVKIRPTMSKVTLKGRH